MDAVDSDGMLADNIAHFGRVLRTAGFAIGPGRVAEAIRSVEAVGIHRREDFYWALHAVFVSRHDQHEVFDQAFGLFWRDPRLTEQLLNRPRAQLRVPADGRLNAKGRVVDALQGRGNDNQPQRSIRSDEALDAAMTWSDREIMQTKDFEQMSDAEIAATKVALTHLKLPFMLLPTRRFRPDPAGALADLRATLRASARRGGEMLTLQFRRRKMRSPPLVVLCDISGSMDRYSRVLLHFLHMLSNNRCGYAVSTFLFGTRLSNVSRQLRRRDLDQALAGVVGAVDDWSGGTRIGTCLAEFNLRWGRRVLGQNAVVLFISDGLDRDAGAGLARQMDRLHRSCRRLIWLNPLLRYAGFEPRSSGAKAILPHVDDFRPVHNLASLNELAALLSVPDSGHR